MTDTSSGGGAVFITEKGVRDRFGVKARMTTQRWLRRGVLPSPVVINGRKYWRLSDLEEMERKLVRETAAAS